jgi:hypothetical protein
MGDIMTARQAARARRMAQDVLAYRAWSASPSTAVIPSIAVISDTRIHRLENNRELRLAQNGRFSTPAAQGIFGGAPAL